METLAKEISNELKAILDQKATAILAVPGGSTPKLFFEKLNLIDLHWERVIVLLTDERFVPESDKASNSGFVRTHLLKNCASKARLLNFFEPDCSIEKLAGAMSGKLKSLLPIDLCILGMGSDMHTASIFPDADRLNDALDLYSDHVLVPISSPSITENRLTLTAKVIRSASKLHLLITGCKKKAALDFALKSTDEWNEAPIRSVLFMDKDIKIHYAE